MPREQAASVIFQKKKYESQQQQQQKNLTMNTLGANKCENE